MSSCILLLDETFDLLLERVLRPLSHLDESIKQLQDELQRNNGRIKPIFEINGLHYAVINRDNLYFAMIMQTNNHVSPLSVLNYLEDLYQLIKKFIGMSLNKLNVRDNFHLIFELIDESSDYGIIQVTNYNIIHDFIKVEVIKSVETETLPASSSKAGEPEDQDETYINSHILRTITSAVSWRPKGINYGKNEFFLDVVEKLEFVMDLDQGIVRDNAINGTVFCRCYLSGMPQLSIGFNKLIQKNVHFMKRLKFHECVDLDTLLSDDYPIVRFIPPDGEFELCSYRLNRPMHDDPVIKLESATTTFKPRKDPLKQDRVLLRASISTHFKSQDSTKDLCINIPVKHVIENWNIDLEQTPLFKSDIGEAFFNLTEGSLVWKIPHLKGGHGDKTYELKCKFEIWDEEIHKRQIEELHNSMDPPPLRSGPKLEKLWKDIHEKSASQAKSNVQEKRQPCLVAMEFEIPYYAVSGLKVEYLKIEEPQLSYQSFPWVRYKSLNDREYTYQVSI